MKFNLFRKKTSVEDSENRTEWIDAGDGVEFRVDHAPTLKVRQGTAGDWTIGKYRIPEEAVETVDTLNAFVEERVAEFREARRIS